MITNAKDDVFSSDLKRVDDFSFNRQVANVFDDMVSRSVPFYGEIQRMIVELAANFAQSDSAIYDLGCSTGTTLLNLANRISEPNVKIVGVDNAEHMLQKAQEKLEKHEVLNRCELVEADLNDEINLQRPSVVIMNWTLQFLRPLHRDALIKQIYNSLLDKGCFILMGEGSWQRHAPEQNVH